MLTEEEWKVLDDEQKQHNNYLDYMNDYLKNHPEEAPVDRISNSNKGANLTEKEQKAATRAGVSSDKTGGLFKGDKNGEIIGPNTGIRFDPYKKHEVMLDDGSWAVVDKVIDNVRPTDNDEDRSAEAMNIAAANGEEWAEKNLEAQQSMGHGGDGTITQETGQSKTPVININAPERNDKVSSMSNLSTHKDVQGVNKYRPKSIMSAYYDGDFGEVDSDEAKDSRNYLLANTLGTFARNLGKDFGNVGAQYSGGTIDNNRETDQWKQMQMKQADPEWQAQQEARERDNLTRALNNASQESRMAAADQLDSLINNSKSVTERTALLSIQNALRTGQSVSDRDLAVLGGSEALNWLGNLFK